MFCIVDCRRTEEQVHCSGGVVELAVVDVILTGCCEVQWQTEIVVFLKEAFFRYD